MTSDSTPLLRHPLDAPSVFRPEDLMEAVRADRGLVPESVPALCVLDFDGDLADGLPHDGTATPVRSWACFHTKRGSLAALIVFYANRFLGYIRPVWAVCLAGEGRPVLEQSCGALTVDDPYVREAILNPSATVAAGFPPVMPSFAGRLTEEELQALVAYLKSLSAPPQETR